MTKPSVYRTTGGALSFDAYYKDEWGIVNASDNCAVDATARAGFHKNIFTSVVAGPPIQEQRETFTAQFENRANPHTNNALKDKSNPVPESFNAYNWTLQFYCSDKVRAYAQTLKSTGAKWDPGKAIDLTLYFGVGTELVRHGIRTFFKKQPGMQAIMQIEGIEKPRFGVAIDDAQIVQALRRCFAMKAVAYRIKVLAAFSTGACGLNQTLLNDLVDVAAVERLVFYDCLYELECGNTAAAIRKLKRKARDQLKIVVYKTSEGGNNFKKRAGDCIEADKAKCPDYNRLAVIANNPGLIDGNGVITNLFQQRPYIALIIYRALEGAVGDGVVNLVKANERQFRNMQALLAATPRGTMISNRTCFSFVRGALPSSGVTFFEDWTVQNNKIINAFSDRVGDIATVNSYRRLLWRNSLPGWGGGDGEDKHDLLIPEFGWEYLPY